MQHSWKVQFVKWNKETQRCLKICPVLFKEMKNSVNVWRHRLHSIFNLVKLCLNSIFLSLKNKKPHSFEIRYRLLWMLVRFLMNYQTNFIFKIICLHVTFFFHKMVLSQFWRAMRESYPQVSELVFRILLPFSTTYICESGVSALVQVKPKALNRRKVEDDIDLLYLTLNHESLIGFAIAKSTVAPTDVKLSSFKIKYLWSVFVVIFIRVKSRTVGVSGCMELLKGVVNHKRLRNTNLDFSYERPFPLRNFARVVN